MPDTSFSPSYENGVPIFTPTYEDFRDFRSFISKIEPIGMTSGIVKIIPPKEWLDKLPKLPTESIDRINVRNPIVQNVTMNGGRGIYLIDNIEKRRKFTMKQWMKQCNLLSNQPPTKRGERQRVLGRMSGPTSDFVSYDDSDFTTELLSELEAKYWKGLAYGGSPMYGADLPGSLFTPITKEWNISDLDSILKDLPEGVPGVTEAYLYCGMWKATFSWHVEDMDLPSINYIHFGAPKQWYSIPQSHHKEFYKLMSALWPEDSHKCTEFLRHKTFLMDPQVIRKQGIPVNQITHRQQEFIVTFPYGYHAGFNYGFNIAESVNFAHDSWLEIGLKAQMCKCVSHSVGIDVAYLLDRRDTTNSKPGISKYSDDEYPDFQRSENYISSPDKLGYHDISKAVEPAKTDKTCIPKQTDYHLESYEEELSSGDHIDLKSGKSCDSQIAIDNCKQLYRNSFAVEGESLNTTTPLRQFDPINLEFKCPEHLAPGDIIQFRRNKSDHTGVLKKSIGNILEVQILPEMNTIIEINKDEIIDISDEQKRDTGKRQFTTGFEQPPSKRIKWEPEGQSMGLAMKHL